MKILLPYTDLFDRPLGSSYVTGGVERFSKHLYDEFNVVPYVIPFKKNKERPKQRAETAKNIVAYAQHISADIIVSNFPGSIFTGKEIAKSPVPVMKIEHVFYSHTGPLYQWRKLREYGHSLFFVSKHQYNRFEELFTRRLNEHVEYDGIVSPSFMTHIPAIEIPVYDLVTVGRTNSIKDPFLLHRMTKKTDLDYRIHTSYAGDDEEYYEKYKKTPYTYWNWSHSSIMKMLAYARVYVSTCPKETWGVSALEALAHGVPLILMSDASQTHASESIVADTDHYRIVRKRDKQGFLRAFYELSAQNRYTIQSKTYERHNRDAWKQHMMKAMTNTIDRFEQQNTNLFFSQAISG